MSELEKEALDKLRLSGKILRETREEMKNYVREGMPIIEICEKAENLIRNKGGKPAFPCNVSINEIARLCAPLQRFPQVLVNVRVKEKIAFSEIPGLAETEAACRAKLGSRSRILLRYSGTERLARVMVEGRDGAAVERVAAELAAFFERI